MVAIAYDQLSQQLPDLLDRVARGERFTIVRDGKPVAELSQPRAEQAVPSTTPEPFDRLAGDVETFRKGKHIGTLDEIRKMINEGRR